MKRQATGRLPSCKGISGASQESRGLPFNVRPDKKKKWASAGGPLVHGLTSLKPSKKFTTVLDSQEKREPLARQVEAAQTANPHIKMTASSRGGRAVSALLKGMR